MDWIYPWIGLDWIGGMTVTLLLFGVSSLMRLKRNNVKKSHAVRAPKLCQINFYHCDCGFLVAQWLGRWTCDWRLSVETQLLHCRVRLRLRNDLYCVEWGVKLYSLLLLRQVVHTHFASVAKQYNLVVQRKLGNKQAHRATHRLMSMVFLLL